MRIAIMSAVVLGAFAAPATAASSCKDSTSPGIAAMRLSQPLVAVAGADADLRISARADGCVSVHYPAWDTRAGNYSYRLDADELASLQNELNATGAARFDAKRVREDLAVRDRAKAGDTAAIGYLVTDDAVIEMEFATGEKSSATVAWSGLRGQLLNHPDQEALIGLAAARDRLLELAVDDRMTKEGQP